MNQQHGEHVDDLIDAYALGALEPDERARVEDHLETCSRCRTQLTAARARSDELLFSAPPATPPAGLRSRIIAQVHAVAEGEHRGTIPTLRAQTAREAGRQGLLARVLGSRLVGADDETLQRLAALVANPESLVWEIAGTDESRGAIAQLVGPPGGHEAVLVTAGLAPLARDKAYQVWLLRGGTPSPNAVFRVGRRGRGWLTVRSPVRLSDLDMVAVTPEPSSGSTAPTGPIVLAGKISG